MLEIVGVLFGIFDFGGVHSKPGCQRHHALEFWMILGSGSTRNYWRIKIWDFACVFAKHPLI